jgi:flagellar assembly protein FliH
MVAQFKDVRRHQFRPLAVVEPAPADRPAQADAPELEQLAEAARREGYAHGYEEGLRQARDEQQAAVVRVAALVGAARAEATELVRGLERQVVELSLALAEKLVAREIRIDPGLVLGVVASALDEAREATVVRVLVSSPDYPLVAEHWAELDRSAMGQACLLVADERIEPGGCLIETTTGQIDAQPATRLAQAAALFDALIDGEPV